MIDRHSNAVIPVTYESAPLFFLHTINAYEEAGHLVVDLCAYANADMLECMYLEALKAKGASGNSGTWRDEEIVRGCLFLMALIVPCRQGLVSAR